MALYSQLLPTTAAMTSVVMIMVLKANMLFLMVAPVFFMFYGAIAALLHIIVCKRNPEQRIENPLSLILFSVWIVAGRFIQVLAMCTLDSQDWGTRTAVTAPEAETTRVPEPFIPTLSPRPPGAMPGWAIAKV